MTVKVALLCGMFCFASVPAGTAEPRPIANYPMVHQVICAGGKGTAFRIGPTTLVTAEHVSAIGGCTVDGIPFTATPEKDLDVAILDYPLPRLGGMRINCEGFKPGRYYFAVGYAKGWPWQTMVVLYATYRKADNGQRMLLGSPTVIPGQSGGPVMDETGAVVGVVNAYSPFFPISFSRELKDTSLCK